MQQFQIPSVPFCPPVPCLHFRTAAKQGRTHRESEVVVAAVEGGGTLVRGDKMSPRWVDQTFVQRFPARHNDTPRAHNGTRRDELGRQRRESLFGAHAWAARGQKDSLETALAAAKEGGSLFIIQSKEKRRAERERGEELLRRKGRRRKKKARQNTLWGRNEGWIIQGGSGTV